MSHECPRCHYRFEDAASLERHLDEGRGCTEVTVDFSVLYDRAESYEKGRRDAIHEAFFDALEALDFDAAERLALRLHEVEEHLNIYKEAQK